MTTRWASFDCYGTLIDWNTGIRSELGRIFGELDAERLLARYHELEPEVQRADPSASYRDVMAAVLARIADEERSPIPVRERDALGRSLSAWPAFPEVTAALEDSRGRGWRLAILSNTDRDLIEASIAGLGVPFELAVVASEIRSYKPARSHWDAFYERTDADPSRHVHVAASLYHDIRPAAELGIKSIWINRLAEESDVPRAHELTDLTGLADALDAVAPAS